MLKVQKTQLQSQDACSYALKELWCSTCPSREARRKAKTYSLAQHQFHKNMGFWPIGPSVTSI